MLSDPQELGPRPDRIRAHLAGVLTDFFLPEMLRDLCRLSGRSGVTPEDCPAQGSILLIEKQHGLSLCRKSDHLYVRRIDPRIRQKAAYSGRQCFRIDLRGQFRLSGLRCHESVFPRAAGNKVPVLAVQRSLQRRGSYICRENIFHRKPVLQFLIRSFSDSLSRYSFNSLSRYSFIKSTLYLVKLKKSLYIITDIEILCNCFAFFQQIRKIPKSRVNCKTQLLKIRKIRPFSLTVALHPLYYLRSKAVQTLTDRAAASVRSARTQMRVHYCTFI